MSSMDPCNLCETLTPLNVNANVAASHKSSYGSLTTNAWMLDPVATVVRDEK